MLSHSVADGAWFSIENPLASDLWRFLFAKGLGEFGFAVDFDQCAYGAVSVAKGQTVYLKKPTRVFTTIPALEGLRLKCPGTHSHELAFGKHAKASACYPPDLCNRWAALVCQEVSQPGHVHLH